MRHKKQNQRGPHTCPVWAGYLLVCPLRKLFHPPDRLLRTHVKRGMKVLEIGPGMGFFTIPMAKMIGPEGRIYAVDIQKEMLTILKKRAEKRGLSDRIETILASPETLHINALSDIDFCLLFAVVHEVASPENLFEEIAKVMKPGGHVLMAEPKGHVSEKDFQRFVKSAIEKGFVIAGPAQKIFRTRAILFRKG